MGRTGGDSVVEDCKLLQLAQGFVAKVSEHTAPLLSKRPATLLSEKPFPPATKCPQTP